MLNELWESSSSLYKGVVLGAMALIAVGLVLCVIGGATRDQGLIAVAIWPLGAGLVAHLAGLGIRTRDARRRLRKDGRQ